MSSKKPLFIAIEGLDGSGKTTQIELLKNRFEKNGQKAIETHEPTGSPIGTLIRETLRGQRKFDPATLAALFAADRLDHIQNTENGMLKKLEDGYNVICSRYYFSNYAFQSEFVPIDWLVSLNKIAKSLLKPDIIFYIHLDPEKCCERIAQSRHNFELYETLEKLTKTHEAFLSHFEEYGKDENIQTVDGNLPEGEIAEQIWEAVENWASKKSASLN